MNNDRAPQRRPGGEKEVLPAAAGDAQTLLQRLVGRLCVAFAGSDRYMDDYLDHLRQAMRQPVDAAALEQMLAGLIASVSRSDALHAAAAKAAAAPPAAGAAAAELARSLLLGLLERLDVLAHLQRQLDEVKSAVAGSASESELLLTLDGIVAVVNQQRLELERGHDKVTAILRQVTSSLDEMARHVVDQTVFHDAAAQDSSQLNQHLAGEFSALDASVREAADLSALQQQVRFRLDLIGTHLRKFEDRQSTRLKDYKAGTFRMKQRVEQLERETRQLQITVQREQHRACTDPLTGIPNRLAFQQRVGEDYLHWKRSGIALCIAMWDIDRFKLVNDTYGHRAGDNAIRIVAQHLSRNLRKSDFVARYGGEEFVAIFRGIGAADALAYANRVRQSLQELGIHFDGKRIAITASCGVAACAGADTEDSVIERADAALYEAKNHGRNRCVAR